MGGPVGKALDPTSGKFLGLNNVPIVGRTLSNAAGDIATGGLAAFGQSHPLALGPWGGPENPLGSAGGIFGGPTPDPYVPGPFTLDPNLVKADKSAITDQGASQQAQLENLAKQQYQETLGNVPSEVAGAIQQENPQIMEDLNKNGLLTSSAYPQEIARQQEYLTQNLLLPATEQLQSAETGALQTGQGFKTGALQRGLSLEDQINNANISKQLGKVFAPQAPTGKQNFGTAASGVGALAPWFQKGGALGKA